MSKKVSVVGQGCVACGSCTKVCPKQAISIYKGQFATVNKDICVGCGLCAKACPAGIISIMKREEVA